MLARSRENMVWVTRLNLLRKKRLDKLTTDEIKLYANSIKHMMDLKRKDMIRAMQDYYELLEELNKEMKSLCAETQRRVKEKNNESVRPAECQGDQGGGDGSGQGGERGVQGQAS
jgi:hypothetical protein